MSTAVVIPFAPKTSETAATIQRYQRAYAFQKTASAFAETVSLGGMAVAGLLWVCAVIAYQAIPRERSGFPVVTVCFIAAALWIVLVSQVASRGFRLQAQMLEATLDAAVAFSPFLSNPQRSEVMSLREPPALEGWECLRVRDRALLGQHRRRASPSRPVLIWRRA